MTRLSSPVSELPGHSDIVVIGSGYGAAIAASRFSRSGHQVVLLERGNELQPTEYPSNEHRMVEEMQAELPEGHVGRRTGLYDFNVNDDITVFKGCGLGGTSLVNANVVLPAEPRVFEDPAWPAPLRADLDSGVARGYQLATDMLRPSPYPDDYPQLPKLLALQRSADALGAAFYRPPINVNFTVRGRNHVGVDQQPCTLCGNCVSGCNDGAKNTLLMNYLPDARAHGARLFTGVDIRWLERADGHWRVHYQLLETGREEFGHVTLTIDAGLVVVGGGALGSTEILLRSARHGLALSTEVGTRFTGNGDTLGFAYDTEQTIDGVGLPHKHSAHEPVGPCISGVIDLRAQPDLDHGIVIEDGSPPGALAGFLPTGLAGAAAMAGRETEPGIGTELHEAAGILTSLVEGPYHGAVAHTQTFLAMTHDDGAGRMVLADDRLRIEWPGLGDQPAFGRVNGRLLDASRALGGVYVHSPVWHERMANSLVTAHPLGGCPMGEDASQGVVNHKSQVFAGPTGTDVYDDLYVIDGSIMPRPLGVNPLLTICALAERAVALAADERGWQVDYVLDGRPLPPSTASLGVEFTERMAGECSFAASTHAQAPSSTGEPNAVKFTLTIACADLDELIAGPKHAARIIGTLDAPMLSPEPMTVTDGQFNLFIIDPTNPGTRDMRYRMRLRSAAGDAYFFDGVKHIHDDPGADLWHDTTTLYVTVYRGVDATGPITGTGTLHIRPLDFMRQLHTIKVLNAPDVATRVEAEGRFARFFLGVLARTYVDPS